MSRRTWTFVIVGAILGAAVGLVYVLRYDLLCISPAIESAGESCQHDEIFGWQPDSLAVPNWTLIGLVGGGVVGWVAAGPIRPIRLLLVGGAVVVGDHILRLGVHRLTSRRSCFLRAVPVERIRLRLGRHGARKNDRVDSVVLAKERKGDIRRTHGRSHAKASRGDHRPYGAPRGVRYRARHN